MQAPNPRLPERMPDLLARGTLECAAEITAVPQVKQTIDTMEVIALGCGPRGYAIATETLAELQWRITCNAYLRGIRDGANLAAGTGHASGGRVDAVLAAVEKAIVVGGEVLPKVDAAMAVQASRIGYLHAGQAKAELRL